MSRADVRAAVAAYLAGGGIPGLQQVYEAMPTIVYGELVDLSVEGGAGAVAWLHLGESEEDRWAFPSKSPIMPGGIKKVGYPIAIMVAFQYLIPSDQLDPPISPDAWVKVEDAIIQGIKDLIHADPQLGTGPTGTGTGVIFEAAQLPGSLRISPDDPQLDSGKVISYHSIEFPVTEVIQA